MVGVGFEPTKAEPADLQSAPFDRFGTPPANDHGPVSRSNPSQGMNSYVFQCPLITIFLSSLVK
ncbi:uncharacterized protein METZ01_LOCUS212563 [marine metagenome]|uniref:Uncharacterized protein n=1 Tax=marine metagenome TaxID=408172 RepID=A0A382FAM0_9ZZZZ